MTFAAEKFYCLYHKGNVYRWQQGELFLSLLVELVLVWKGKCVKAREWLIERVIRQNVFCQKQTLRCCVNPQRGWPSLFAGSCPCSGLAVWREELVSDLYYYTEPVSWCFFFLFSSSIQEYSPKTKRKIITNLDFRLNFTLSGDFKAIIHNEQDTASKRVAKHIFTWQAGLIDRAQQCMTTIEVSLFLSEFLLPNFVHV